VSINGTLVEDKCVDSRVNMHIYTHDGASAKFNTISQETDNSVSCTFRLNSNIIIWSEMVNGVDVYIFFTSEH
jgi:hypothetical protein